MKRISLVIIALVAVLTVTDAQNITPDARRRAKEYVEKMTLEEKVSMLSGATSFSLHDVKRLDIPTVLLADGPVGLRNHAPHSTLYPASILTAATWNRDLFLSLGQSLGDDSRARGVGILLGPGVNIYRSPLCGRNYEYFGEDPFLTGEVALQYIKGVQSRGVLATIKHFAGNNQEWSRHHVNSQIDERTLFEMYLPAFEKAVKKGGVGAVMDSYNLLNGVHSTENTWLNRDVLRKRWGFDGILMSDWTSVYSTIGTANSGLDLEMPKGKFFTIEKIKNGLDNGTIDIRTINEKVQNILETVISFGIFDRQQKDSSIPLDCPSSAQTALDLAREGIVMLKNDGALPLKGTTAIVGPNATVITTGGGSGNVVPFHETPLSIAMDKMAPGTIMLTDDVIFEDISDGIFSDSTFTEKGFKAEYFKNKSLKGEPAVVCVDKAVDFDWEYGRPKEGFPTDTFSVRWLGYYVPQANETVKVYIGGDDGYRIKIDGKVIAGDWGNHAYSFREKAVELKKDKRYDIVVEYFDNISSANIKATLKRLNRNLLRKGLSEADNVVYCAGFNSSIEGEGFDRPFELPQFQQEMINEVASYNPNTTVVINAGGGIGMNKWMNNVKGIVMAWYPGQEGGTALAEILTGKISPSGKLPISIERRLEDNPCNDSYYQNTDAREVKTVEYTEGLFCGYRGYDRSNVKPLYPFGYGLSYTTFDYSDLKLRKRGKDKVEVSFIVKNTGDMEAKDVAQIYVSEKQPCVVRPLKELKGFEKVSLRAGETKRMTVMLGRDAFQYYDVVKEDFTLNPGVFTVMVGRSAEDIILTKEINMK